VGVVLDNLDRFAEAFWVTVQLTALGFLGSLVLGTLVATMRVSPVPPLRGAGLVYVETFRNTPLLVLAVLFVFGLTKVGIQFSLFTTFVVVISIYTAAFVAEALRSGMNAVSRGQAEAARSIGLTFGQSLREVILPQAFRTVVQPLGNVWIAMTKNTSIAAAVSVVDLTAVAGRLTTDLARPIPLFAGAAIGYLLLTLPMGLLVGAVERRVAIRR